MNRRNFLALASIYLFSGIAAAQKKTSNKATVLFSVDLHCDACVKKIMKNIAFEKGITDLKPDLKAKQVAVTYRTDKTNVANIQAAFKKIGYEAKEITNKE